jgi:hypothetical protein
MDSLVGYTGFVGGNIACVHKFDKLYNSKNITEAFGSCPDLLVYAGVPSEMFLARDNPEADKAIVETAADNIRRINPKQLVLISTVAVLDNPIGAYEDAFIDKEKLSAYGLNRLALENMVKELNCNYSIIRLPALFGKGLKKNFIFDMINRFPSLLNKAKYEEFALKEPVIMKCYKPLNNGYFKMQLNPGNKKELIAAFERLNFSALSFTDSRAVFQFYNLENAWHHIQTALTNKIPLLHLATEPLSAGEVYEYIFNRPFVNEISMRPFSYDFKTKYSNLYGGNNGYIFDRKRMLNEINEFVRTSLQY